MKTLKTIIAILALSLFTFSCSKNEIPAPAAVAPLQDPLPEFLSVSGLSQKVSTTDTSIFEQGFSFVPLVAGKMTAIVVNIPAANSSLRVTIWDKASGTALLTELVNITAANVDITKNITPLSLDKDKVYIISFNSGPTYRRTKSDNSVVLYPITVGDIKITAVFIKAGTAQTIPSAASANVFYGDCSFKFQK